MAVTITNVLYSGGLTLHTIFDMDLTTAVWLIGFIAALYTTWGGLKAVAWADLFQGSRLLLGGILTMGRVMTVLFVVIGCAIAPQLNNPWFGGVFKYIQEFQGYISPGILAAFVFGFVVKRAPAAAGVTALLFNAPFYALLQWQFNTIANLINIVNFIMPPLRWSE